MKSVRFLYILSLFLFLLLLTGCAATAGAPETVSIYDEIVLDGSSTHSSLFTSGMRVNEVLETLNLKEEDLFSLNTYPLDGKSSPVEGASEMTMMVTKESYCFEEFGKDLPFRLTFTFYDDALRSVTYNVYLNVEDPGEGYDLAMDFMNSFIDKTGAKPVENGVEFEYSTYGSAEKESFLAPGGMYACQFFHGGVLGEISISSLTPSPALGYDQEVMVQLGISMMLDRLES